MSNTFQKTYAVPKRLSGQYSFSTMVRHQGTIVSFAMDDERRIWYTVLDLANHEERGINSPIDSNYWLNEPRELIFPKELAQVGYAIAGYHTITAPDTPEKEKTDGEKFRSTTARLSAEADFEVFSDEKYIYLFRQAIDANHADIDKTEDGVVVVDRTLLVDRFLLQGTTLLSKKEVRYQRSRHKDKPHSRKDSLGYADMEKTPFVEPTQELSMVRNLKDGRFTVSLIPTSVPGISRWQIFAFDEQKDMIVSYSIERSVDGLFNLRGTQYYTSPETQYKKDVFQARPGTCPFSHQPLIPVLNQSGSAEYALSFENDGDGVKVDNLSSDLREVLNSSPDGFTLETRIKIASLPPGLNGNTFSVPIIVSGYKLMIGNQGLFLKLKKNNRVEIISFNEILELDEWHHVALVGRPIENDNTNWKITLFLDGIEMDSGNISKKKLGPALYLGSYGNYSQLRGQMDEFRLWNYARSREDLLQSLDHRLTGEEPGLALYYRFDESQGTRVVDYGPNALHGTIRGTPTWKVSDAEVGDHPGLRKSAFQVQGREITTGQVHQREITTGLSSLLYYQQENLPGGYDGEAKPMKYNARVMLSFGTKPTNSSDPNKITCLDFGISREGKLAHIPDVLSLPEISAPTVGNISYSQYLDDKSELEGEITTLVHNINILKEELQENKDLRSQAVSEVERIKEIGVWGWFSKLGGSLIFQPDFDEVAVLEQMPIIDDANGEIIRIENAIHALETPLQAKKVEIEGKIQDLSGERVTPISLLHMDLSGLTLAGGIMDFAESNYKAPHLVESANGKLILYFNDPSGRLNFTNFDTLTDKALYEIECYQTVSSDSLLLSLKPGSGLAASDLSLQPYKVESETDVAYYKLTLYIGAGTTETWPNLPRNPQSAAQILNGADQNYDYSQASSSLPQDLSQGSTFYTASTGQANGQSNDINVATKLPSGSLVLKARVAGPDMDTVEVIVADGSDSDHCTMTLWAPDLMNIEEIWPDLPRDPELAARVLNGTAEAGEYSQASITTDSPASLSLQSGSILFNAIAEEATGLLDNTHIVPATTPITRACQWIGQSQGNSLYFDGVDDVIHLGGQGNDLTVGGLPIEGDQSGRMDPPDDFTIETWFKPKSGSGDQVLLDHRGNPHYQIGLLPSGNGYHFYAGVNDIFVKGISEIPADKWSHIAASYDQSYALSFDGDEDYLDCGNDLTLDIADELTLEVFLKTGNGNGKEGILSKGVLNNGQEGQVPYALHLDTDRKLVFSFEDKDGIPHEFKSTEVLQNDTFYKVAVTRKIEQKYNDFLEQVEQWQTIRIVTFETEKERLQSLEHPFYVATGTVSDAITKFNGTSSGKFLVSLDFETKSPKKLAQMKALVDLGAETIDVYEYSHFDSNKTDDPINGNGTNSVTTQSQHWSQFEVFFNNSELYLKQISTSQSNTGGKIRLKYGWVQKAGTNEKYEGQTAGTNSQSLTIGMNDQDDTSSYFKGVISEVRIWNTARIGNEICSQIRGGEKGLVSWWRMEENEGNVAYDAKGSSHATRIGANWIKNPDPDASGLQLHLNGVSQTFEYLQQPMAYGVNGFHLGALTSSQHVTIDDGSQVYISPLHLNNVGVYAESYFTGELEELRIWKVRRTEEEIQDNLHRRLLGERAKLIAYYQFDAESGGKLTDQSGRGVHLSLGAPGDTDPTTSTTSPVWMISTAPVGYETPQIRSALSGVSTDFHESGETAMIAREYGDMQYDAEGNMTGAMKRAYTFIQGGKWQLITGFKVGNIVTEWVGQAQYDPQVVGFIEGAPPVPSENLTSTTLTGAFIDYQGISSVELQEAEELTHHFSSSRDNSFDMAMEGKIGAGFKSGSQVGAAVGVGAQVVSTTSIENSDIIVGLKFNFDQSFGWSSSSQRSQARSQRKQTKMELTGYWEKNDPNSYYDVGRRFLPYNKGLALVKSETADIFALRLEHNHALIAFRMLPNPDIPKDWNLIHFPINPQYVKQGTLDGRVGFKQDGSVQYDEDYPNVADYGEYSYFKPREAYAMKKRIQREEEMARELYQNFQVKRAANAAQKGAGTGAAIGAAGGSVVGGGPGGAAVGGAGGAIIGSAIGAANSDTSLPELTKRNLMNTFVWTAEGGFFAETQQTMDVIMEETAGNYKLSGKAGMYTKSEVAISKVAVEMELNAMFGGSLSLATTKSENSTQAFSVEVKCENDGDLQVYVNDKDKDANGQTPQFPTVSTGGAAFDSDGKPILRPGKVDAYRFMTFYLQPNLENFEELKNKVIDPDWLEGSSSSARAMRQAIGAQDGEEKSIPWRIMHRVTYVSRILPEFTPNGNPLQSVQVLPDITINSNYELIQALNPFVMNKKDDYVSFTDAIRKAVNQYYSELKPAMTDIIEFMSLYHQVFPE